MQRHEFDVIVEKRLELIKKVLLSKGKEYASEKSAFHNFEAATGLSFHKTREKVAWEYMVKHLQSIKDILNHIETGGFNGYPSTPLVEEKLGDAINYLILIEAMLHERISKGQPG